MLDLVAFLRSLARVFCILRTSRVPNRAGIASNAPQIIISLFVLPSCTSLRAAAIFWTHGMDLIL